MGREIVVIGLKNCDGTRKARRALEAAGLTPRFRDIREKPLTREEMTALHAVLGDALVNRRSATWRGLDAAVRNADPATLLAAHPTLMKRPVIMVDGRPYLGWSPETRAALLGNAR